MRRMPLAPGATFAGFTIVRLLGSGSTGAVYLAEHPRIPSPVALTVLRADVCADSDFRQQFSRDAAIAVTLEHPNIARVHDYGEFGPRLWLAMDYIDGVDAGRMLSERYPGGMPVRPAETIIGDIADALDFSHRHGLVHGHVSPANILIADPYSQTYRILLTDFGTVHRADTSPGNTPVIDYAAPSSSAAPHTIAAPTSTAWRPHRFTCSPGHRRSPASSWAGARQTSRWQPWPTCAPTSPASPAHSAEP
jgi:serine/threonine-protein kinase